MKWGDDGALFLNIAEGVNKGIIATISNFSADAIKRKSFTPLLLDFVDKDEVFRWVKTYLYFNTKL